MLGVKPSTSSSRTCARNSPLTTCRCSAPTPSTRARSARHLDRAAPDRQAAGRDRPRSRGRRNLAWLDRQGQRPVRYQLSAYRSSRHQDHRALARVEFRLPHRAPRLRRAAPDPDRQGQAGRHAVLDRRQPPARLLRGQVLEDPAEETPHYVYSRTVDPDRRPTSRRWSRSRSRRATRSPSTARR